MKIAAVYCIYDEPEYLDLSIEPIKSCFDKVLFLVGSETWNGPSFDNSLTLEKIKKLCAQNPHFELIQDYWKTQAEQRNFGLEKLVQAGIDYAFIIDSDEIYHEQHIKNIKQFIIEHPQISAFHIEWNTYWTKDYYVIHPREAFRPLIVAKVKNFLFTEKRGGKTTVTRDKNGVSKSDTSDKYNFVVIPPEVALCHHLSYARSNEFIQKKITSISAAPEIHQNWYKDTWLKWQPSMKNLHPVDPTDYRLAVKSDFTKLPPALQVFIKHEKYQKRVCTLVMIHSGTDVSLQKKIEDIGKYTSHPNLEIIVINKTKDHLQQKIENLDQQNGLKKIRIFDSIQGSRVGDLNKVLFMSTHTDICLLDENTTLKENWLNEMYKVLISNANCGLVGAVGLETPKGYQGKNFCKKDTQVAFLSSYCLLITKELIDKIGFFDTKLKSEVSVMADFALRTSLSGFTLFVASASEILCSSKYISYQSEDPVHEAMNDKALFQKFYSLLFTLGSHVDLFYFPEEAAHAGLVCL